MHAQTQTHTQATHTCTHTHTYTHTHTHTHTHTQATHTHTHNTNTCIIGDGLVKRQHEVEFHTLLTSTSGYIFMLNWWRKTDTNIVTMVIMYNRYCINISEEFLWSLLLPMYQILSVFLNIQFHFTIVQSAILQNALIKKNNKKIQKTATLLSTTSNTDYVPSLTFVSEVQVESLSRPPMRKSCRQGR